MSTSVPDYDLPPTLEVGGGLVHRALGDPRRRRILSLLSERAATARQLAAVIDRTPQATTHHLDVLQDAGLVRVVRTERVRATQQRWWGRTARTFVIGGGDGPPERTPLLRLLEEVAGEEADDDRGGRISTVRYARIPADRAEEWCERLAALADEFAAQPRAGEAVHGLVLGLFPTDWRPLPQDDR